MKRRFRLTKSTDFQRVRRQGKPIAHPLVVLIALPNDVAQPRVGVSAGRSVGTAVQRNRAKRLLRAAIWPLLPIIAPGWDIVLLSRQNTVTTSVQELQIALEILLRRANLLLEEAK